VKTLVRLFLFITSHQAPNFQPNYYILLYRDLHMEYKVQQKKIDLLKFIDGLHKTVVTAQLAGSF